MTNPLDKPRVLTEDTQKTIVAALAGGNYLTVACRLAGITVDCFYYWKKLFDSGAEHAQVYADFFGACDRALATAECNAVATVNSGGFGWQGPAWYLERRYPKRWGKKDTVTLKGIPEDLSTMTQEQLDALDRRLANKGRHRA